MSKNLSDSDSSSNSENTELDPEYIPSQPVRTNPSDISKRETRSRTRNSHRRSNSLDTIIPLIDLKHNTPIVKSNKITTNKSTVALSLETDINLVPKFNGQNSQEVYPFLNTCDFVTQSINEECCPILLQVIISKLAGKAFAAMQHREVKSWGALRGLLEITLCAKRTPGYQQNTRLEKRFKNIPRE